MKRERPYTRAWLAGILLVACAHGAAWALTDEEIFRDFRFNFVNPGARSLSLGGAFIAAADDATAAQANPAALHYVNRDEFFVEYRRVEPEVQVFSGKSGNIADVSTTPFLSLQAATDPESSSLFSFASYAHPFRIGSRRARFAVSRQIVLDANTSLTKDTNFLCFSSNEFPIWFNPNFSCASSPPGVQQYAISNSVDGNLEADLLHYNASFSFEITKDFSFGLTGTYATLDMNSRVTSTSEDPRGFLASGNPRLPDPSGAFPDNVVETVIDDSDAEVTYTVGLHWHPDLAFGGYSPVRFGLVYRKGAELSVTESQSENSAPLDQFENVLREPDRFGIGASYDLAQHWLFALDVERIQFSDLLEGFRPGVNFFTSGRIANVDPSSLVFTVDDATVVHFGTEFYFTSRAGWGHAIRVGYYNAPDNRIRLTEIDINTGNATSDTAVENLYKDVFRGGEDVNHYAVGFSLNTPIGLQFQLAGDFAEDGRQFVASAIYRFGKQR